MKVKSSKHAKYRANERLNVAYKAKRNQLFNRALKYGHPPADFTGEFRMYLESKKKNKKNVGVKVYDNNIFIYKNKLMITVFPVPERFIPTQDNLSSYIKGNPLLMKLLEVVNKEDVLLEVVIKDKNSYVSALTIDDIFENFGIGTTETKSKNNAIRAYLKRIGKLDEEEDNDE